MYPKKIYEELDGSKQAIENFIFNYADRMKMPMQELGALVWDIEISKGTEKLLESLENIEEKIGEITRILTESTDDLYVAAPDRTTDVVISKSDL